METLVSPSLLSADLGQLDRDIDDLGICTHMAQVMLQYAF